MFEIELIICIKMDLALNNQQSLIFHKTQTSKEIKKQRNKTRLGGKDDPQGIMQEIGIWPYNQMVYTKTRIYLEE